jgi:hypothetical protein
MERAIPLFEQTLSDAERMLGPDYPDSSKSARRVRDDDCSRLGWPAVERRTRGRRRPPHLHHGLDAGAGVLAAGFPAQRARRSRTTTSPNRRGTVSSHARVVPRRRRAPGTATPGTRSRVGATRPADERTPSRDPPGSRPPKRQGGPRHWPARATRGRLGAGCSTS